MKRIYNDDSKKMKYLSLWIWWRIFRSCFFKDETMILQDVNHLFQNWSLENQDQVQLCLKQFACCRFILWCKRKMMKISFIDILMKKVFNLIQSLFSNFFSKKCSSFYFSKGLILFTKVQLISFMFYWVCENHSFIWLNLTLSGSVLMSVQSHCLMWQDWTSD